MKDTKTTHTAFYPEWYWCWDWELTCPSVWWICISISITFTKKWPACMTEFYRIESATAFWSDERILFKYRIGACDQQELLKLKLLMICISTFSGIAISISLTLAARSYLVKWPTWVAWKLLLSMPSSTQVLNLMDGKVRELLSSKKN